MAGARWSEKKPIWRECSSCGVPTTPIHEEALRQARERTQLAFHTSRLHFPLFHLPLFHSSTLPLFHSSTLPLFHSSTQSNHHKCPFAWHRSGVCKSLIPLLPPRLRWLTWTISYDVQLASCVGCQLRPPDHGVVLLRRFSRSVASPTPIRTTMEHGGIEEYTHRIGKFSQKAHLHDPVLTLIGRTGRIGHRGLATSFFTERDEPMDSVLTRLGTLQETDQDIPDLLEQALKDMFLHADNGRQLGCPWRQLRRGREQSHCFRSRAIPLLPVESNPTASATFAPVVQVIPQLAEGWTNPTAYDCTDNGRLGWRQLRRGREQPHCFQSRAIPLLPPRSLLLSRSFRSLPRAGRTQRHTTAPTMVDTGIPTLAAAPMRPTEVPPLPPRSLQLSRSFHSLPRAGRTQRHTAAPTMADTGIPTPGGSSDAVESNPTASVAFTPVVQVIPQPAEGWTNPTAYNCTDNGRLGWRQLRRGRE
jgi:hypothetical protein